MYNTSKPNIEYSFARYYKASFLFSTLCIRCTFCKGVQQCRIRCNVFSVIPVHEVDEYLFLLLRWVRKMFLFVAHFFWEVFLEQNGQRRNEKIPLFFIAIKKLENLISIFLLGRSEVWWKKKTKEKNMKTEFLHFLKVKVIWKYYKIRNKTRILIL